MSQKLWVDTNVILRMVTGEPPDLAIEVREFMKKVNHREYILRISPLQKTYPNLLRLIFYLLFALRFRNHGILGWSLAVNGGE